MEMQGGARSSQLSSYDREDKEIKNMRELIYDYSRGEIIDPETGEVIDQIYDYMPNARASDYAEWLSKIHHSPLRREFRDKKDKEIYLLVQSVGAEIGAPRWLREEVFQFLRKAKEKKSSIQSVLSRRRQGAIKLHDWKFVLATYYVLSKKRGLYDLAESIGSMKCGDEVPCYRSKKLKDDTFYRFMTTLEDVYRILTQENFDYRREVEEAIRRICQKLTLPPAVLDKAIEKSKRLVNDLGGSRPRNVAIASLLAATNVVSGPEEVKRARERMIKELKIPESSIREIMRRVPDGVFEVVYCIFYRLVSSSAT